MEGAVFFPLVLRSNGGSEPAREGGVPVGENVGCTGLIASSLSQDFVACPFMQMIEAFRCVYECFSITHGIMHAVMNSK
jgi:hypothetical protein